MPIEIRVLEDVHVLMLSGEFTLGQQTVRPLDLSGRPLDELHATIGALLDQGVRKVVLHLEKVTFVDSAGLAELVSCKKRALERGGDIRLVRPAPNLLKLLEMTCLDRVFRIFQDEAEAVRTF